MNVTRQHGDIQIESFLRPNYRICLSYFCEVGSIEGYKKSQRLMFTLFGVRL